MPPTYAPAEHKPHRVLIAGESVLQQLIAAQWESSEIQELLTRARLRFGNALCSCRPGQQLKLQIRTRASKSHLAVWPEEGPLHDTECLFFRDELAHRAASQSDEPHAANRAEPASSPAADASQKPAAAPDYAQPQQRTRIGLYRPGVERRPGEQVLSIRAIANRLWWSASLCRWHPSWTRDWGRVRYELFKAAATYELDGQPAETALFVPRVFREEIRDTAERNWDAFVRSMMLSQSPRILVGQVRGLVQERDGQPGRLLLRHLRKPIGLHRACHDFLLRECRSAIANSVVGADDGQHRPELIAVLSVESSTRGGVWARSGWLIAVHPSTYIPAPNQDALHLVDALVAGGHAFEHLPSETQSSHRLAPDWLVRHVRDPHGVPVARAALEVMDPGSSPAYVDARAAIAVRLQQQGIPTWSWKPAGSRTARQVPPLPPNDRIGVEAARAQLQQIREAPEVEYRYGPFTSLFPVQRKAA